MSKLLYREFIMNILLLSIVSCLLLSNINYASEKPKATRWSFPALRMLGIVKINKSDSKNAIPKTVSQNTLKDVDDNQFWTKVENDGIIDLNNIDSTLIEDYCAQKRTTTSPTTPTKHSPSRIRTESFSVLHTEGSAFELYDASKTTTSTAVKTDNSRQLTLAPVSIGADLFSKTTGEQLDTARIGQQTTSENKQTFIEFLCGCCFKKIGTRNSIDFN